MRGTQITVISIWAFDIKLLVGQILNGIGWFNCLLPSPYSY